MAKLSPKAIFKPHRLGWLKLSVPPSEELAAALLQYPGVERIQKGSTYNVPEELEALVTAHCQGHRIEVQAGPRWEKGHKPYIINPLLHEYQREGVLASLYSRRRMLNFETGLGKASANSAKVLGLHGWTEMGLVKVGDGVYSGNGKLTPVLAVFPQGKQMIYKVSFNDGTSTRVTKEHLWTVTNQNDRFRGTTRVLRTDELMKQKKPVAVPIIPIRFPHIETPIHPYLLGVMLGDGCLTSTTVNQVRIANSDLSIEGTINALCDVVVERHRVKNLVIKDSAAARAILNYGLNVKAEGKFVPDEYLYNCKESRRYLLCGLMDTDGYVSKDAGAIQYTSVSERLAENVAWLVRSLGGWAKISNKIPTYTYKGKKLKGQRAYTVTMNFPTQTCLFYKRDKALRLLQRKWTWAKVRNVVSVKRGGKEEATCIKVAHESHLYITDDFIATHNTPSAIEVARLSESKNIIVVCPALMRETWAREFAKWWPDSPKPSMVYTGKEATTLTQAPLVIISYELLQKLTLRRDWDIIILDEVHYAKTEASRRAKYVRQLCHYNPSAIILGLTATPITKEPKDLWHQLHCLFPGRFGKVWDFYHRYALVEEHQFGTNIHGLNEDNASELNARFAAVSNRATKAEVAHLLPPLMVQTVRVRPERAQNYRALLDSLASTHRKQHDIHLDKALAAAGGQKINHAVKLALDSLESVPHVAVLTHFRATADEIAKQLRETLTDIPVAHVDGAIPTKERGIILDNAKALDSCVLVATMHSVNVGIDLTKFSVAVFAELYWQPAEMIQALGRFSRLSGVLPSTCLLLVLEGSMDESISFTLHQRLVDMGAVQTAALGEAKLCEKLGPEAIPEEEFLEDVLQAVAEGLETDEYL